MRHRPQELERFVEAIVAALPEPASILVIGGAAAALAYGVTRPTNDLDTFHPLTPVVQKAVEAAQRSTGLTIPVSFAAVADAPAAGLGESARSSNQPDADSIAAEYSPRRARRLQLAR